jgi:hypothetical protein
LVTRSTHCLATILKPSTLKACQNISNFKLQRSAKDPKEVDGLFDAEAYEGNIEDE